MKTESLTFVKISLNERKTLNAKIFLRPLSGDFWLRFIFASVKAFLKT